MLPKSWGRLYSPLLRDAGETGSERAVQLKMLLSNAAGYISRADWVESCFSDCEDIESPVCFLHTGQRVNHMWSRRGLVSLSDIINDAFCGMLMKDLANLSAVDNNIAECMSWDWLTRSAGPRVRTNLQAKTVFCAQL